MKIILLRHEEREIDIGFYSNLTEKGINSACISLPYKLKFLNIDIIFSSPFIRTLQTIYPYALNNNILVNVEYALYEYLHNPYFLLGNWYYNISDIKDNDLKDIINPYYTSIIQKKNLCVLEDEENLGNRIKLFIDYLKKNYDNKSILLVTHKGVINKFIDIYIKKNDLNNDIPMGSLHIYDI